MDDRLIALDAKTGKEILTVHSPEQVVPANGYAMTGAPLIVNGVVIMGVAGAEFSHCARKRILVDNPEALYGFAKSA